MPEIRKIISEYILDVEGLGFAVRGRVTQDMTSQDYFWEISHYYRPSETAGTVYIPSKRTMDSLQGAENLMFAYMRGFTSLDVKANEHY